MPSHRRIASVAATALSATMAVFLAVCLGAPSAHAELEFEAIKVVEAEGGEEEIPVPATLDAAQVEAEKIKMSLSGLVVSCQTATASAPLEDGASPSVSFSPTYEKCKGGILYPVTVSFNGCTYTVKALSEVENDLYKGSVDLLCPSGKEILITVKNFFGMKTTCLFHVPPQTGLTAATVQNMPEASPEDITIKSELEAIKTVVTNGEEACPTSPGTYTTGKITGNTTVTATGGEATTPPLKVEPRNLRFRKETQNADLTLVQDGPQKFTFDSGKIECETLHMEAVSKSTTFTQTIISGDYGKCKWEGKVEAGVTTEGCDYKIVAKRIEFGLNYGRTHIECAAGWAVKFSLPGCTIVVPNQSGVNKEGLKYMRLDNIGAGKSREVEGTMGLRGIEYEEEGELCASKGQTLNGRLDGSFLMRALEGAQVGLWLEPFA